MDTTELELHDINTAQHMITSSSILTGTLSYLTSTLFILQNNAMKSDQ